MKRLLPVVVLFCLVAPAGAAKRVVVTSLPEPVRAFAETETNVAFSVGATTNSTWKLSVELDASASNCVEVVLDTDADGDGALGVAEGELSVQGKSQSADQYHGLLGSIPRFTRINTTVYSDQYHGLLGSKPR